MKTAILTLVLLAVAGFGAAACDGGSDSDEVTLETYFLQLASTNESVKKEGGALAGKLEERVQSAESEKEKVEEYKSYLAVALDAYRGYADGIDGLSAPAEVENAHDELVRVVKVMLDSFEAGVSKAANAESLADVASQFEDESFLETSERFERACAALEAIAEEHGIDADLHCADESEAIPTE